jgi:DNA invertase Pin-like site-specific DNA recombinase
MNGKLSPPARTRAGHPTPPTDLMASLAEFEHDLLRERVRSGIAAAKARRQTFGRRPGYRPSDRHAPEVLRLSEELSQRGVAERFEISKTTVNEIIRWHRMPGSTLPS